MFPRLAKGEFAARRQLNLAFVVLAGRLDAEIVVAGIEIDFLVGARLFFLVDRQLLGLEIPVLRGLLVRLGRRPRTASAASTSAPARESIRFRTRCSAPDRRCRGRKSGSSTWGKCAWCPIRASPCGSNSSQNRVAARRGRRSGGAPCHRLYGPVKARRLNQEFRN